MRKIFSILIILTIVLLGASMASAIDVGHNDDLVDEFKIAGFGPVMKDFSSLQGPFGHSSDKLSSNIYDDFGVKDYKLS